MRRTSTHSPRSRAPMVPCNAQKHKGPRLSRASLPFCHSSERSESHAVPETRDVRPCAASFGEWQMAFRNLMFAGAAIAALNGFAFADDADTQTRALNTQQLEKAQAAQPTRSQLNTIRQPLAQVGPDGMPATSEEKAR